MNDKVDHVRRARHVAGHTCHWPGCTVEVKPAVWGCRTHWYRLPAALRNEVWRAYRPGQEDDKNPSASYVAVARKVQTWIAENVT